MDRKKVNISTAVLIAGALILGITHYYYGIFDQFYDSKYHLTSHILLEFLSISIAFAISILGWMIFTQTISRHRMFIGTLFFSIALIDILHVLSYRGMPPFLLQGSIQIPTWLWILSRFSLSIGLLIILTRKEVLINKKYRLFFLINSLLIVCGIAIIIYFWKDQLPVLVIEGSGVTPLKKWLEYLICLIFVCLLALLINNYRKEKRVAQLMLINAVGFSILAEIIFTFYQSVYDFDNLIGHIYKVISYHFFMRGLYESTLEEPYQKQRDTQLALSKSKQRLDTILNTVPNGIIISNSAGYISYVNPAVESITGYKSSELLGENINETIFIECSLEDRTTFPFIGYQTDIVHNELDILYKITRKNGEPVFLSVNFANMVNENGDVSSIIYSLSDITELMNAQEKINYLAYHDELTGLPNRYFLKEQMEKIMNHNYSFQGVTLILINLNRFRMVNDSLGNDMGDAFIATIADRLRSFCESLNLIVSRMGGDEFAIIYTHDSKGVEGLVNSINQLIGQPIVAKGFKFHIDSTIGISIFNENIQSAEQFIQTATIAMHEAKKNNQSYMFYYQDADKRLYEDIILENELRRAIENNELVLYYQPQVNLKTGKLMGVEALVRWNHPAKGLIPPGKFITLAEETGLIVPIGKWVIEEACRQIKEWHYKGFNCQRVSVNLSMRQFFQEDLVNTVQEALDKSNLSPQFLELEITESMTMDVQRAISMLKRLKELGVRIAIDDFGTGYSSFSNLHLFPIDQLKIDRSFIKNISLDQSNDAIVGTIISLGHHLQLELMAEGVETVEQANFLLNQDCSGIQGYLISKPLPTSKIETLFLNDVLYSKSNQ